MLAFLGLQPLPTEMQWLAAILAFSAIVSFGWATDMFMRERGFGPIGNALVGTAGAILGPHLWFGNNGHGFFQIGDPSAVLTCAGLSGLLTLFAAALLKKALATA
jgi:hypothetical protein